MELADAAAETWIVKPEHNDSYDVLVAACAAAGFTPRVGHHLKEWFAVSAAVAHGDRGGGRVGGPLPPSPFYVIHDPRPS